MLVDIDNRDGGDFSVVFVTLNLMRLCLYYVNKKEAAWEEMNIYN